VRPGRGAPPRREQVDAGHANAAAVVVAELLERCGLAVEGSLRLGSVPAPAPASGVLLGFTTICIKVRALPFGGGGAGPAVAKRTSPSTRPHRCGAQPPARLQGPGLHSKAYLAFSKMPGRRRFAARGDAVRMAGAGLCREAGALAHKLLLAWDPPAELPLRVPRLRKARTGAKRRRDERGDGKGGRRASKPAEAQRLKGVRAPV
jgi:hypothetical protein